MAKYLKDLTPAPEEKTAAGKTATVFDNQVKVDKLAARTAVREAKKAGENPFKAAATATKPVSGMALREAKMATGNPVNELEKADRLAAQMAVRNNTGAGKFAQRLANVVAAAAKDTASSMVELGAQGLPTYGDAIGTQMGGGAIGAALKEAKRQGITMAEAEAEVRKQRQAQQLESQRKTFEVADKLKRESQEQVAQAKEGLGRLGQFGVDLGFTGVQMAGDVALSALVPGSGLVAMGARSFGSGAGDARREGKDAHAQLLTGAKSAAIEVLTEKLFDGLGVLGKAYGSGALDDAADRLIKSVTRSEAGRKALRTLAGAAEEGLEEVASDLLNPVADKLLGLSSRDASWLEGVTAKQVVYDALLGSAMGLLGGAGEAAIGAAAGRTVERASTVSQATKSREESRAQEKENPFKVKIAESWYNDETVGTKDGLLYLLNSKIPSMANTEAISTVTGNELPKDGNASNRVIQFFNSMNNRVVRPGFGEVLFSKSKIKNSILGHGYGEAKVQLAAAVPGVIEKGRQIAFVPNWKNRGYDSYVFAGKVNYKEKPVYVAAIVIRDSANRYYLHEALDENGNTLYTEKESPESTSDRTPATPKYTVANSELSEDIVHKEEQVVKNNRSTEGGTAQGNPFLKAERQRQLDQARDIAKRFGAALEISPLANAEGRYANGVITIDPETENPVRSVLVHELTHHMENGGLYERFAQKVMDHISGQRGVNVEGMLAGIKADYAAIGQNLTDEGARRELVAKYAQEHLFTDEATVKRLLAEDRNLFQRIYDWIRDSVARLTGSQEQRFLIEAQNLYEKALREAGQTVQANPFLRRRDAQYSFAGKRVPTYEELIAKPDLIITDIRAPGEAQTPLAALRSQILSSPETQALYENPPVNKDTGETVFVTPATLTHSFSNLGMNNVHATRHLREIIENAVLTHAEPSRKAGDNTTGVYTLFGAVRTENGVQPVKLKVKEYRLRGQDLPNHVKRYFTENGVMNPFSVAYDARVLVMEGIEKEEPSSSALTDAANAAVKHPSSSSFISVQDLMGLVNSEYRKYLPKAGDAQQAAGRGFDELARETAAAEDTYMDALAQDENAPGAERYTLSDAAHDAQMQRLIQEGPSNPFVGRRTHDVENGQAEAAAAETAAEGDAQNSEAVLRRETVPAKAFDHLQKAENRLTGKITEAMGIPSWAGREQIKPIVQKATEEYLNNGRVSDESLHRLFEEAWRQGVLVDDTVWWESAEVRNVLRQEGVTLGEAERADVGDYAALRKRAFGRVRILNEGGTPVNEVYERLNGMDAALFPADITHPAEQLQRMVDVAESLGKVERHLTALNGEEAKFYRTCAENDFEAAIRDMEATLRNVRRYSLDRIAQDHAKLASPDMVKTAYSQIKQLRRAKEKAAASNLLTEADKMKVGSLLRGEIKPEMLDPKTDNVKGILDVYEASTEYEYMARVIRDYNKTRKSKLLEEANRYLKNANQWKDKHSGYAYMRETMERNIRDITGRSSEGDALVDAYIKPVHANEAEATRFKNKLRDRIRGLKLSREVAKGNEVSEAYAVQLIGEAENAMAMLKDADRGARREGKTYEDWKARIDNLWQNNPNLDEAKVRRGVEEFRNIYDDLFSQLNEVHLRNGYEPISYRSGYFPHFQQNEPDGVLAAFGKAIGAQWEVTPLPTSINGLTAMFKPGKRWMGEAMERRGYDTVYDAIEGFDRYLETAADVIYHTDDIQRLRALAQQIRYRTTDEGIQKQIDDVRADNTLTELQKQDELNRIYDNGRFTLNNFVLNLEEYTNLLAGKKSKLDRAWEEKFGDRRWYSAMQALEGRVAANMVGVNPGSWLTNFIPIAQTWGAVDTKSILRAMGRTLGSTVGGNYADGLAESSDFLTNRRGSERLALNKMQKVSAAAGKGMEIIDNFTSEVVVRARYLQNIQRGMSETAALEDADAFAASVMADRSKGAMPTLFHARNPVTKLFTQFQLEVNNQLSYLFKDMPGDLKERGTAALAAGLLKFFVGSWLYNELYEKLVGRRPALDPIGMLNDFSGDLTGWEIPNLVDFVSGKDRSFRAEKKGAYGAVENLGKNVAEELPFVGGVIGGGRLPVSSALPNVENIAKASLKSEWSPEKRWATVGKELGSTIPYYLPPFGGGQLKKIYQGLKTVAENGSYSVDAEGNKLLQFPVYNDSAAQTAGNYIQAAVFGKTSLPGAQEWIDSGFKTYSAKETAAYRGMLDAGVSGKDAIALLKKLRSAEKTEDQSAADVKRSYLRESGINGEGRSVVYYGMLASEKEQAVMDEAADLTDAGLLTDTLIDIKNAEKDDEESAANVKRKILRNARLDGNTKRAIYYNLLAEDGGKEQALMDELADHVDAEVLTDTLIDIKNAEKSTGKIEALQYSHLPETQKAEVYMQILSADDELDKAKMLGEICGLTPVQYYHFVCATKGLTKRDERLYAINQLDDLNVEQKNVLYHMWGYKDSTIENTPWYNPYFKVEEREESTNERPGWLKNLESYYGAEYGSRNEANPFVAAARSQVGNADMLQGGFSSDGASGNPFLAVIQRQQQGSGSTPRVGVSSGGGNPFLRAAAPSGGNPFLRAAAASGGNPFLRRP